MFDEDERASWFSHKSEEARPYYYRTYLADWDVVAEVTPTERAAIMQFTFPESELSTVIIDPFDNGSHITIDLAQRRITGYTTKNSGGVPDNFHNWFVIEFDKPFTFFATVADGKIAENQTNSTANHAGGIVGFRTRRGEKVSARIASSFISQEQALRNLEELDGKDFNAVKAEARARWNDVLGRIEIEDSDIDRLRTFYSCLYRSVLFPRSFYEFDSDGKPVHYSPYNGKTEPGYMFTDTGFWDTFRALFPLLNLMYPSVNDKIQDGLANAYKESGFLPEWASPGHRDCMVGNNSVSVVADAWLSGVRSKNIGTLWEAVVNGTTHVHPKISSTGRLGHEYYNKLGYVPYDAGIKENAARTLEYAYDDWCIYQLGKSLGKPEKELKPYAERALNYRNLYDPDHRLMRGRNKDGQLQSPFNPLKWGDAFTEGNSWHYSWSVFHDPQGLIDLMGGNEVFTSMLDSVFSVPPVFDESYYGCVIHEIREMQIMNMGNYAHGNQPIQHMIYLYDWAGQPWKTQYWVRETIDRLYSATPDGYCGDEDNGQTSAWYVFSALGFYPVCPGSGQYALGAPLFRKSILHLENGKTITIDAPLNSRDNRYFGRLTLNGREIDRNYLTQQELKQGCLLQFEMQPEPSTTRGTAHSSAPYSFTNELKAASAR